MDWTQVIATLHKTAARDMNAAADAEAKRETGQAIALKMAAIVQNRIAVALDAGLGKPVEEKKKGGHQKPSEAKLTAPKKPRKRSRMVKHSDFQPRNPT